MRLNRWALGLGIVALLAFSGYKWSTTGDGQRTPQIAVNQVAPALGWKHVALATTSSSDTSITFGAIANLVTGFSTTTACSIAFSVDPALVAYGWEKAAAADTFLAGHPRAGEAVRDTSYAFLPAGGSLDIPARFSLLKVKGTGTGKFNGTFWFNY